MTITRRTILWRAGVLILCLVSLAALFWIKAYRQRVLNEALIAAVSKGDLVSTQRMIKLGADPESQEYVRRTTDSGFVAHVLSILNPPKPGRRALFIACVKLHIDPAYGPIAECMVKAGASPYNQSEPKGYVMNSVARCGTAGLLSQMLAHGAKVDEADGDEMTPLMYAAGKHETGMVKELLSKGANPNRTNIWGVSTFEMALSSIWHEELVLVLSRDLLNHHANPNGTMSWNSEVTYYSFARSREWPEVTKLLLAHGARAEGKTIRFVPD